MCFPYTTLFGIVTNPFILNFLIQFHLDKYKGNECAGDLKNKFYVDYLLVTSENTSELVNTYESAVSIMAEGNFCLRSCTKNYAPQRDQMKPHGFFVEHDGSEEKLLGYKYNMLRDSLKLNPRLSVPEANPKRKILAQSSAVFGLLSLCLPVTIKGRLLLRDLWKHKLGWDDAISEDLCTRWKVLYQELLLLNSLEFPRQVFNDCCPADFYVFCYVSKSAYGFAKLYRARN